MAFRLSSSLLKSARGPLLTCGPSPSLCTAGLNTSVLVPAVSQCSAHVQLWRLYQTGAVGISSVQHLASSVRVCRDGQLRCVSTKAVEGDSVQHMPLFQRFWRWLHDLDDIEKWDNPPDSQTQAELDEREVFLNRVQAMYFADPPQTPDLQFCKESLEMLMKYNDRVAVETLWNILPELKVEPDDELKTRVMQYLKKARLEAYYE